ncbi:hypothetical protein ACWKWU_03190 [Chitinophaga lutea]
MGRNSPDRIAIYAKDVALLLGRSEQSARRLLREIRQTLAKTPRQIISLREFCDFVGLDMEEAREQKRFS